MLKASPCGIMSDGREVREAKALMCLLDATIDRSAMKCALKEKIYPAAIFHAQQMSEKAAKACLVLKTDYLAGH